jgi:hypothetical protein
MAVVANTKWGGLTAAWCCEACDVRASRKIFLRKMKETYKGGRLVGPVARMQAR